MADPGEVEAGEVKIVGIIQARMNSTRLPGKVMLPLAGEPMIERIVERVKRAKMLDEVVIAWPTNQPMPYGPVIVPGGVEENDLVTRFIRVADIVRADIIVRLCADNPCVDPNLIDETVEYYLEDSSLFVSSMGDKGDTTFNDGFGCEVFSVSRLKWLDRRITGIPRESEYREHPHKYFCSHNHVAEPYFRSFNLNIHMAVDTQADYDRVKPIWEACYAKNPEFTMEDVIAYVKSQGLV